jgi:hypothetical protein
MRLSQLTGFAVVRLLLDWTMIAEPFSDAEAAKVIHKGG